MIIELRHLADGDIPEVRKWVIENSHNPKLLIGPVINDSVSIKDWTRTEWPELETLMDNPYFSKYFRLAVDIPDENAVYFKLTWG